MRVTSTVPLSQNLIIQQLSTQAVSDLRLVFNDVKKNLTKDLIDSGIKEGVFSWALPDSVMEVNRFQVGSPLNSSNPKEIL